MNDLLELLDRGRIVHDARRQFCAVDLAVDGGAGEGSLDRGSRFAFIELMHGGIRIVDGHTGLRE